MKTWYWQGKGEAPKQLLVVYEDGRDEVVRLQDSRLTILDRPATFWAVPDVEQIRGMAEKRLTCTDAEPTT